MPPLEDVVEATRYVETQQRQNVVLTVNGDRGYGPEHRPAPSSVSAFSLTTNQGHPMVVPTSGARTTSEGGEMIGTVIVMVVVFDPRRRGVCSSS